ncbi:MAG: hypothetical protein DI595_02390 [Agrobacterium fabrum]|uniref:Uncharacterized protein n=1 Tax=Agrobacterium fabrum TaxID=1176649 RepID=A0A2W5FED3_9HYPH|nr:MAG: hypothetical protein DI595_02390 [Agrobacterium fabrum]
MGELNSLWPATIAGSARRRELHHPDCEAVAARMDRLYTDAPLEANERAALIFLYSAKLVIEDLKLRTHRVKKVDLADGAAMSDPWSDMQLDPNESPVMLSIKRAKKIADYVTYLELRYFERNPRSAYSANIAPSASSRYDDIVFCADTGCEIAPGHLLNPPPREGNVEPIVGQGSRLDNSYPFEVGFTLAEYDESMERYILARRAHLESGGNLDEWTDLENRAVLARIESERALSVESHEPEPL